MYYIYSDRNGIEDGGFVTIEEAEAVLKEMTSSPEYSKDIEFDYKSALYIRFIT